MSTASYLSCTARQTRGKFYASEIYQIYGCTGATPIQVLADALAATGLPGTAGSLVVTIGAVTKSLGVATRTPKVDSGSNDTAEVEVTYTEDELIIAGYGPTIKEFNASLEQINTEYDYANRSAALAGSTSAVPITVTYGSQSQIVSVPWLAVRPTRVWTREESTDPEAYESYIGKTNSATFGAWAVGTCLCVNIRGIDVGTGRWRNTFAFAKRDEGWKQFAKYTFANGEFPRDAVVGNGILVVTVQGTANFNALNL